MGRELKRVALDFEWPLNKVWDGYLNHYSNLAHANCEECGGSGLSASAKVIQDLWYTHLRSNLLGINVGNKKFRELITKVTDARCLSKKFFNHCDYHKINVDILKPIENKIFSNWIELKKEVIEIGGSDFYDKLLKPVRDFFGTMERPIEEWAFVGYSQMIDQSDVDALWKSNRLKSDFKEKPTAEELNKFIASSPFGHDAINLWVVTSIKCKQFKQSSKCRICKGEGYIVINEDMKIKSEGWTPTEPPKGDGFQLWGTTNEGSPMSPVFKTAEELAEWCEPNATIFGSDKISKEKWLEMFNKDFIAHQIGNSVFI